MGKFFPGQGQQGQCSAKSLPENGKNRGQRPAEGPIPECAAGGHGQQIPHPQISGAEAKAQIEPEPKAGQQKQGVCRGVPALAHGAQKAVEKAQQRPQQQAHTQPEGGSGRGHPSSRLHSGSGRGSS